MVRDEEWDFVLDGIGKFDILSDVVVKQIGCSKGGLAGGRGFGLATDSCRCALGGLYGEVGGRESAVED